MGVKNRKHHKDGSVVFPEQVTEYCTKTRKFSAQPESVTSGFWPWPICCYSSAIDRDDNEDSEVKVTSRRLRCGTVRRLPGCWKFESFANQMREVLGLGPRRWRCSREEVKLVKLNGATNFPANLTVAPVDLRVWLVTWAFVCSCPAITWTSSLLVLPMKQGSAHSNTMQGRWGKSFLMGLVW